MALLTEEQQNVAVAALASTLGKPVSEIETILTGEKPNEVDTLVSERIKAVRTEGKNGGKGELQKIANRKAKELFNTEAGEVDTIEGLLTTIKDGYKPKVDPSTLTEEQIKSSAPYRTLESTLTTERTNHANDLVKAKAEAQAEVVKEKLTAKAMQALTEFGAVLAEDSKLAAVQKRMYLEQLEGITMKEVDGKTEFWKADPEKPGELKRIETDKLIPVEETDFLKGLVGNIYTTKVSEQKTSTGLKPEDGQQQQKAKPGEFNEYKGEVPKTQEDVNKILMGRDTYTLAARNEVRAFWDEQQKGK